MSTRNKKDIKSIILLSGGLDSVVALGVYYKKYAIDLALTFDYGQKSAKKEIEASSKISAKYGIKHQIIKLDWLREITHTALVSDEEIPTINLGTEESAAKVWVPNRNGLFLNIAASFADSYNYNYIIYGANKDEGATFPDNTELFRKKITSTFKLSTLNHPKVIAPLINYSKNDIVKIAINNNVPLEYVRSCYSNTKMNCGTCESCTHFKQALKHNGADELIKELFEK